MSRHPMIVLFTDFGATGPYVGQMVAALYRVAPESLVVTLFSDAPRFDPVSAGYLLAAYTQEFNRGTIFLCVVDPGVGSELRRPIVAEIDGCFFVGPDNGLFNVLARRATDASKRDILWCPRNLSATFHGRDLFAPIAASLASNQVEGGWLDVVRPFERCGNDGELFSVIYIDGFGNLITGIRASVISKESVLEVAGNRFSASRTFSDVAVGVPFWYENSSGLVEVAVNCGSAAAKYSVGIGEKVLVV